MRRPIFAAAALSLLTGGPGCASVLGMDELPPLGDAADLDASLDASLDGQPDLGVDEGVDQGADTADSTLADEGADSAIADTGVDAEAAIDSDASSDSGPASDSELDAASDSGADTQVPDTQVPDTQVADTAEAGPLCGNGRVDPGETCDTAIASGTGACPSSCSSINVCQIATLTGSACTAQCQFTDKAPNPTIKDGCCPPGATSLTDADCLPVCGNGVLEAGETCDTAIPTGTTGACPTASTCTASTVCQTATIAGTGCSATCQITAKTANPTTKDGCCPTGANALTDADCLPVCGNGVLEVGEGCDDHNLVNGDGCSSTCTIEPGYSCYAPLLAPGYTSVCVTIPSAPSCTPGGSGMTNCGPTGSENCCTSPLVVGGTFSRSYDGVTFTDPSYQATISDVRIDKYEVTVGRFRQFVAAASGAGAWTPPAGSGKHAELNAGRGLNASAGGYESGWLAGWATNVPSKPVAWNSALSACTSADWTSSVGANESLPIECVNWYQAYAFCIWDGGFLPSEAEWDYAAAAGAQQRVYPWGSTAPGNNTTLAVWGCYYGGSGTCTGISNIAPVGAAPAGIARWGQLDLAGGVWEWALDYYHSPYFETSCVDCAYLTTSTDRLYRGGSYYTPASASGELTASYRYQDLPISAWGTVGFRCARAP